uniref:Sodium/nucleoside cotransporter n=1 Tax=Salarias fasciatus TaxID=181472 RepID=A0A672IYY9_SALFA
SKCYVAMVIAACVVNFHEAVELLVISLVTVFFLGWDWTMERYGDQVWERLSPIREPLSRNWFKIRWVMCGAGLLMVVSWLVLDTARQGTRQLVSFSGLLLLIFLMLVFSKHPFRWSWRTLLWGTGLQFIFGLLFLRTTFGLSGLEWLGKQVEVFLSFTDAASEFVFGDSYMDHFFVFQLMPILVFISSVTSILHYIGFIPWLIRKIGFIMQVTMGTSPAESMAAAGNIFLGNMDAPLLIYPYIRKLTVSEFHAVMTGGFASVSGTVLGAFVSMGVEAAHLMTASLMSAPASLAIAKMFWPETETSTAVTQTVTLKELQCKNVLEAASQGAHRAIQVVATIIVNIIAFMALLGFLDAVLSWLGGIFGYPQLSFSFICSYVFMPLAFMMGVSWEDSFIVAELIGIKTFLNEFVAYQKLSELIKKRKAGGPEYVDNIKQYISVHSEAIATYALCGFSNIASLGMSTGVLSAMAPERQADIYSCGLRSLIAGSVSCFMTACIAGMLYIPDLQCQHFLSLEFNNFNLTNTSSLLSCCTQLYNRCVYQYRITYAFRTIVSK